MVQPSAASLTPQTEHTTTTPGHFTRERRARVKPLLSLPPPNGLHRCMTRSGVMPIWTSWGTCRRHHPGALDR
jgi:hypothetical protein